MVNELRAGFFRNRNDSVPSATSRTRSSASRIRLPTRCRTSGRSRSTATTSAASCGSARWAMGRASSIVRRRGPPATRSRSRAAAIRCASAASFADTSWTAICRKRATAATISTTGSTSSRSATRIRQTAIARGRFRIPGLNVGSTVRNYRMTDWSWFFADDWKLTSNLTLNVGVRHDYYGFPSEQNGFLALYDFPAALATGNVQDGFIFASNFDPTAVPGAAGLDLNISEPQEHRPARLQQSHAARRLRVAAVLGQQRRHSRRLGIVLRAGHGRVRELTAAGTAVLPRAAAQRRRAAGTRFRTTCRPSRCPNMRIGFDDGEPILVGDNDPDTEFEAFETQMVSSELRDAVHAPVEPHDAVGVPAELAARGRLRRQQGQQAAAVGQSESGDRCRRQSGCCEGRRAGRRLHRQLLTRSTTMSS